MITTLIILAIFAVIVMALVVINSEEGGGLVLFALAILAIKFWYITVPVLVGLGVIVGYAIFG
jgi:hypothetical protein